MTPCDHQLVIPFEPPSRSGPAVVKWRCDECFTEFKPIVPKPPSAFTVWREARRLRKQMEGWRNG